MTHAVRAAAIASIAGAMSSLPAAQTMAPAPQDAIAVILSAFTTHPVVAIDEPHGDERAYAFRVALLRDPRFPTLVHDIVVESGNARYQDVMDRFIAGEAVSYDDLKRVWQDTTLPSTIWDRPIYENFFRAVRDVNAALPRERRLRVLLGDSPIDWSAVHTLEELRAARQDRSKHPADVILREVLAKGRRALVIYGAGHLYRQNLQGPNLIEHVEKGAGVRAFIVVGAANLDVVGIDAAGSPTPSIALTRGSSLENQLDALLYLGPAARANSPLSRRSCDDPAYRAMRVARMTLAGNANAAAQLAKECSSAR